MNNQNLKPFKSGESGNPGGRPKGSVSVTAAMRRHLGEGDTVDKLAKAILSQAARGNGAAIKQVLDRIDGPVVPKQPVIESRDFMHACIRAMVTAGLSTEEDCRAVENELIRLLDERFIPETLRETQSIAPRIDGGC